MALTGSVSKWFNRKGYGFINVMTSDSEHVGNDLFVHLSGINVSNDGYKSLYPGEYVSFDLDTGKDGRFTCVNVTGVLGGPLLIEHPDYRYKYFQRNPQQRDSGNHEPDNSVSETVPTVPTDEPEPEPVDDDNDPEQS
jgi:cold shock CspA family protein